MTTRAYILLLVSIQILFLQNLASQNTIRDWEKLSKGRLKKIQKVIPISGWTGIPGGQLKFKRPGGQDFKHIQRPMAMSIDAYGYLILDHEVTVKEYSVFLAWITTEAPAMVAKMQPNPPNSLSIPVDYYSNKKYKNYPAVGLSAYQIAVFCSWLDFLLYQSFQPAAIPDNFTAYLDQRYFWSHYQGFTRDSLNVDHFSFRASVNMHLTKYQQLYYMQVEDGEYTYDPDNPEEFLNEQQKVEQLEAVNRLPKNKFGLRGATDNAAEPYDIIAFKNTVLDTVNMKLNNGVPFEYSGDDKVGLLSIKGLHPDQIPELLFLSGDQPPELYGFRLKIITSTFFPSGSIELRDN